MICVCTYVHTYMCQECCGFPAGQLSLYLQRVLGARFTTLKLRSVDKHGAAIYGVEGEPQGLQS